jgi:hypothetical protein
MPIHRTQASDRLFQMNQLSNKDELVTIQSKLMTKHTILVSTLTDLALIKLFFKLPKIFNWCVDLIPMVECCIIMS